jgi:Calx-beta domain/FG-GAP-like repeat
MSFNSWLQNHRSALAPSRDQRNHRRRDSLRAATHRPNLEVLEDRCVPSFSPAVSYPTGTGPQAVLTADLNGDGKLDLVTANNSSNNVSVLLGNADGTFQPAQNFATGPGPLSVAVGDFNVDGKLDLVTGNYYNVSVLLGDGEGAFGAASNFDIYGFEPASVAVGDFNGDGKLDLGVTSNYRVFVGYYYSPAGFASVLLGNGDGTLAAPTITELGYGYHTSAAVADFNGDGKLDFATVNDDYGTVRVLLGDGSGGLGAPTDFYLGYSASSLVAGDVNGDGHADLITSNWNNNVSILLGNGTGTFGSAQNYAAGGRPASVVVGDFNNDGNLDLATANYGSNDLSVLRGIGNGAFSSPVNSTAGSHPYAVAAGDFNGDGWLDAVSANNGGGDISVLINDHSWPSPLPPPPPSVSINDVTVTEGNTGATNATFTVSLSAPYSQSVTVHYETANGSATAGSDYMAMPGDVTFGIGETSKTITVLVNGDTLNEPSEEFSVNLSGPTNATLADAQGVGTILNDDPVPSLAISDVTLKEGNSGATNFVFTVNLSAASGQSVTVSFATANGTAATGSDYTAVSGTLTFAPGETSKTITVAITGDRLAEPTETFFVNLSAPTNATIADGQGTGTVLDDEPRISINNVTKLEGNSGTTLFVFTITLSAAYDQAVTVNFATANGTATTADHDYQAQSGTLTFAPGETTKTITIVVYGDKKTESNETFFVDLSDPSSNALFGNVRGIGTILDDDRR